MSCNDFPSIAEHDELEERVTALEAQVAALEKAVLSLQDTVLSTIQRY